MSSALQAALSGIQENDYVSAAVATAVGYDFILTFSTEIEYIWAKPWTWVSTLFVLVRYFGLYCAMISALLGTTFIPGPANVCHVIDLIAQWALLFFVGAADLVMILRVYAMYNRSRIILGALLLIYASVITTLVGSCVVYNLPNNVLVTTAQVLNLSVCVVEFKLPRWTESHAILQVVLGAILCMLALVQFMRQSFQMYNATKRWQLNEYVNIIVKEGLLYFFAILLFNIINLLGDLGIVPVTGSLSAVLFIASMVPVFTLTPRFILNMRELFHRNLQGGGCAAGMDSGFGLSSLPHHGARGTRSILTAIAFAEVGQNEELEHGEEIPMA